MAKKITPLTDVQIRKAKSDTKPYKLSDGSGLYLLVMQSGGKSWRLDFKFEGKRDTLTLGMYPDVSLARARQLREENRQLLASGINPNAVRKQAKEEQARDAASAFDKVAESWFQKNTQEGETSERSERWSESHARTVRGRLDNYVLPHFKGKLVSEIKPYDVVTLLEKLGKRGIIHSAAKIKIMISQIMRHAMHQQLCEHDPAASVKTSEILPKQKVQHLAAIIEPKELAPLLRAIDNYEGTPETKAALQLLPMWFLRPGNLRQLEWSEVDLYEQQIVIPLEKMKLKTTDHIVPLSHQAIEILKQLQPLTGHGKYLFPSIRTATRPMSENTLNAAFRRMGYDKEEVSAHGFRATARTILAEKLKVSLELIEHQLHHAVRDANGRAYNRTSFIDERRRMMQNWADYLDELKQGAKVIPLQQAA